MSTPLRTSSHCTRLAPALLAGCLCIPLAAHQGQETGGQDDSPVKTTDQEASEANERRSVAREIGLGYEIPSGALAREQRNTRGQDVLQILDASDPPAWTITCQRLETERVGETSKTRIDAFLSGLEDREDPAKLLSRTPLGIRVLDGAPTDLFPAEVVYLEVPIGEDDAGVSGLLIAQTSRQSFLYITLFSLKDTFDAGLRPKLERFFESLRIEPRSLQKMVEAEHMGAGASILGSFSPEVLQAVAEDDVQEFYRIFEQDSEGQVKEISWHRLTTSLAPVSEIETGTDEDDVPSKELGLLVTMEGEIVEFFDQSQMTIDVISKNWISLDRNSERWSTIRTPRRILTVGDRRTETEVGSPSAETGIRTPPQPRSTITVIDSSGKYDALDVPVPPQPFISQTELYVIGRLLEQANIDSFEADWYVLDRSTTRGMGIRKRSDTFSLSGDGSTRTLTTLAPGGTFEQNFDATTGLRKNRITPLDANSERVLILERIDPSALIQLYKNKGIPVR